MPTTETAWDTQHYGLYASYGSDNTYELHSGVFALPIAVDPDDLADGESPVCVVQAHAPYRVRHMTFDAKKRETPPVVPSPESAGAFEFLGGAIKFNGPTANQNFMSWDWAVSGQYSYVEDIKSDADTGFVLTSLPFPLETQKENRVVYGIGSPTAGAVSEAGDDAKTAYNQAAAINTQSQGWSYTSITYFPPQLLNAGMVNGDLPAGAE